MNQQEIEAVEHALHEAVSGHEYRSREPTVPTEANRIFVKKNQKHAKRRLVDYTKTRGAGSTSSLNDAVSKHLDAVSHKHNNVIGMPTFRAMEAALVDRQLASTVSRSPSPANREERVEFLLKVSPKSQRKPTRISSLDIAVNRRRDEFWWARSPSQRSLQTL